MLGEGELSGCYWGWPVVTLLTQWPHLWHLCQHIVGAYRWPHSPWENHWSGLMSMRLVHTWNSTLNRVLHLRYKIKVSLKKKSKKTSTMMWSLKISGSKRIYSKKLDVARSSLLLWSKKAMTDQRSDKSRWNKGHKPKMKNWWTIWMFDPLF